MKYAIKITCPSGAIAYLKDRDKTCWCKRTANKKLSEMVHLNDGHKYEMEENGQG